MEVIKILGQVSPVANDLVFLYSVGVDKGAVVSMLNICNRNSNDATVNIAVFSLNENQQEPAGDNYLEYGMIVYGNCSAQRLKGVTLAQGDTVAVWASSANVSFSIFGSEFDQTFQYV